VASRRQVVLGAVLVLVLVVAAVAAQPARKTYTLDGKEATAEAMGGTNTTKATWSGKTLELSSVRAGNFNGNDFKFTSIDKLTLSDDGKTLTISRHRESQRGTTDSTLVLNKQ
jgi:hypothetical protein